MNNKQDNNSSDEFERLMNSIRRSQKNYINQNKTQDTNSSKEDISSDLPTNSDTSDSLEQEVDKQKEKNKKKTKRNQKKFSLDHKDFHETTKNIKKYIDNQYNRYQVNRIKRKKRRILAKKKSTSKEYFLYLLHEFKTETWREFLIFLCLLLLLIIIISSIAHGISSLVSRKPIIKETETETETERIYPEKDITVGSTGCMLLHSPFIDSYPDEEGNYDFATIYKYITPYYSKPDYMTCEFEGALGGDELGYSGYPMFISPDIIIQNIKDSGVDLQMLASNHIYDGWSYGFHRTMDVFKDLGINYTGIRPSVNDKQYFIADVKGIKIGFLDYVYETPGEGTNLNGMDLEKEDWDLVNTFDYDYLDDFYKEITNNIHSMKKDGAQFIIAQIHWGTEYQLQESDYQDEIAQKLCNLGINAIIGGHPHCEQPIDVLTQTNGNGRMFCIYSEGNALSNQRAYLIDEMPTGHTEDGAMITLTLHQDTKGAVSITNIELLPTWVYRYQDDSGSKYYILPLDDVGHIEEKTGITGIKEEAKASYERTIEELGPGLEIALKSLPLLNNMID